VLDSSATVRFAGEVQQFGRRSRRITNNQRTGLARAMSKLGFCSRSNAARQIKSGAVRVNGTIVRNPQYWVELERDRITVSGQSLERARHIFVMVNKPRGLITTASDEKERETVFQCFEGAELPFLSPVGRLDQASEGLLLFTNDTKWASRITDPAQHLDKVYHVQIAALADDKLVKSMTAGVLVDGTRLQARRVAVLRRGGKNSWIEIVLDEGKNRHIRRLLEGMGTEVLRLVRVAIGPLPLGDLAKGQWRHLTKAETIALAGRIRSSQDVPAGIVRS
jgi:23S rRNA pseudouridine2605 synthase